MIFGAIGTFDDYLLSLKFFLNTPPFSHAGGKRHRSNRQHRCPGLQDEKRLVLGFPNERSEAMQRLPHRDRKKDKNPVAVSRWVKRKAVQITIGPQIKA